MFSFFDPIGIDSPVHNIHFPFSTAPCMQIQSLYHRVPQIVFCCNFLIHPYPLHYSTLCPSDPSENSHKTTSFRVNTKNQKVPFHKRVHYICKYIYSCDYIIIYHIIHIPYDTPRYLRQPFLLQP